MYYQTSKFNKLSDTYNIFNYLQNVPQEQKLNTLQPKSTIITKTDNNIHTENSENTITNINPLSKSKESNSKGRNSSQNNLFNAVEYNDLEKVEQILKNDPSQLNELNDEGISPLHISVIKGNLKMTNLLLKYGANANILSEKKRQTPLHLAYLNQNSMTEDILQELKNYNASDSIYDANNKKPSDYLNNSFLKKHNSDDYSSSADKRQIQSNNNTVLVITNENHFDSFMTTNKEDDNKSNVNSTINNNTIQTPTKIEEVNINEYDYNNEPTITINSNNKYNTNNTINSKSDSLNRRQYTFGKEEDYYKFQSKNSDINLSNNNINNCSNNNININNNSIKNMDINYNNVNKNNGKENNINDNVNDNDNYNDNDDFMENIIKAEKLKEQKNISLPISPNKLKNKKNENELKADLNDSLEEEEEFANKNYNNIINKNKNKFYLNNINVYINDNSQSYKSSEKSNYKNINTNNIYKVDSLTKNNGLISNSILTYTDSINANGSTPQSKKISAQATITNSLNSNFKDNIDDIELKIPHTIYNNNSNYLNNENISNDNINNINNSIKNNNNIIFDNNTIDINPSTNLNIDDLYKRIILKKRDSIIKSHRNCYSGLTKYQKKKFDMNANNLENSNSMNNIGNAKNSSFNSQNSNKNSENNVNRTIIHNTSKDNNSSFRNITVIHNNNSHMKGIGNINNDNDLSFYKEKENNENNSICLFTTKSQTNKIKQNGILPNNINENITELNRNNNNNISFLTNNINHSEINIISTNNNKNISEFKYMDNSFNNNMINNSNDNSIMNINEIINEDNKNLLSSLKYWLNNIELINYYPNFINNSIIDISILIERMKSYQTKLKFENIESFLKIRKPGHIYRILCRLEVDANLIDNKITKFLLKNSKIFNKNEFYLSGGFDNKGNNNLHLLISQDYQCLGCCKINKQFSNMVKNDLKSFLKRYGLLNYYQNFYHNGFEIIEYVILQMYGGYPINDDILENCFHVYDEEQRKKILRAIVNEMKKINEFLISDEYNNYPNNDLIKYENIIFYDDNNNCEESKIMINNGKSSNCNIF